VVALPRGVDDALDALPRVVDAVDVDLAPCQATPELRQGKSSQDDSRASQPVAELSSISYAILSLNPDVPGAENTCFQDPVGLAHTRKKHAASRRTAMPAWALRPRIPDVPGAENTCFQDPVVRPQLGHRLVPALCPLQNLGAVSPGNQCSVPPTESWRLRD
jgi:hypothetical protein